jgi:ADP-dependent phosphofructokinase/glucokinase
MHGYRYHRRGPGFRRRRFPDREEWLRRLEEYQKDLEQEVADVADLIRRLKDDKPAETSTV